MTTLYVTSSTREMYRFSGKTMLKTFLLHNQADILYCTEKFALPGKMDSRVHVYDLKDSDYLNNWLNTFKDDIPVELGGNCINFRSRFDKNSQNWNFKASLWFRKVASLKAALDIYGDNYKQIVWVDNDTVIYGALDDKFLDKLYDEKQCFYFLGEERKMTDAGVESGLMGFKKDHGYTILTDLFKLYDSGDFRDIRRWDDGYVIKTLVLGKHHY